MPPRGIVYAKISMENKQNLINAINRGDSMITACRILNIPVRTGQRIYQKYRLNGELIPNLQRGGYKKQILSNEQIEIMRSWIDDDPTLTLASLKEKILFEMGQNISISTVNNYIRAFHYTFKRVAKIANAADIPRLWEDRINYCQWYRDQKVLGKNFIYLDEVGFQVIMRVSYGRSASGVTPQIKAPGIRSRNITVMAAMSATGINTLIY